MFDFIEFETTPHGETCVQVGHDNHPSISRIEAKAMLAQLERKFPNCTDKLRFAMKSNPHDFGCYYTINCKFESDSDAEDLAYEIENNYPEFWDDEAKEYLKQNLPQDYLETLEWAE